MIMARYMYFHDYREFSTMKQWLIITLHMNNFQQSFVELLGRFQESLALYNIHEKP